MRNQRLHHEDDIRGFLARMAGETSGATPSIRPALRRARYRLAVTAVAGVLVLSVAGYGAIGLIDVIRDWNRTMPAAHDPHPPSAVVSSPASPTPDSYRPGSASHELSPFVLPTFDDPSVTEEFSGDGGSVWTILDIARTFTIVIDDLLKAGFVDAYGTTWLTPDWDGGYAGKGKDLISIALLFESPAGARRGFGLFDLNTWDRWRPLPHRGLSKEVKAAIGRVDGYPTVVYIWRVRDIVLVVGSQGALPVRVVGPLADQVQARIVRLAPVTSSA
jgi:hypothetical protein